MQRHAERVITCGYTPAVAMESARPIFLSHTSKNDPFVRDLRLKLEQRGYAVAEDSTFRGGDNLPLSIKAAIDEAGHLIVVVSPEAVRSDWVKRELVYGRKIAAARPSFRVIPLLLAGASAKELRAMLRSSEPLPDADLEDWPDEPIAIDVKEGAGGLDALMPGLLFAIGGVTAPGQIAASAPRVVTELADLVLRLRNPRFDLVKNEKGADVRRPVAEARLAFYPPNTAAPAIESPVFTLSAPLGKIETADLSYYLERYHITPFGVFADRAHGIEKRLPEWGQDLWNALEPKRSEHAAVFKGWRRLAATTQRRFTIETQPLAKLRSNAGDTERKDHGAKSDLA